MEEKLTNKPLQKLLTKVEFEALHFVMDEPGWQSIKKVAAVMRNDWADSVAGTDYRDIQDAKAVKNIIYHQGMHYGINKFINLLQQYHNAWVKENKKLEHT